MFIFIKMKQCWSYLCKLQLEIEIISNPWYTTGRFFCNPILFAICTSTFSKLCKKTYTVARRRVLSSVPLQLIGSRPLVAFGNKTYKLNLKN
jgi:hypothetical protein